MRVGLGGAGTFLVYFIYTAVILSIGSSVVFQLSRESGIPQQIAIVGGVIVGAIGSYFNRTVIRPIAADDEQTLLNQVNRGLTGLGYQQVEQIDDEVFVFQKVVRQWLSSKVYVRVQPQQVTIAGRVSQVQKLQEQLNTGELSQAS
ncbi:hypothetical protein [Leptolyngbya sp. FACHB-711]|uniref:hypothetical protein n=1 Tax=unclassified Leptolyngbya TaxID=2650499 RepID=UPI001688C104|nr:hypothetical protein [Leptolyngbya sp. FACHB-711]MBD1850056.1 hypothetical protein [Cyanobacteria bacterium FACHB-502]MBD2024776.1 hypothetical protein [Leptolyngbya sp. FACHB-711]